VEITKVVNPLLAEVLYAHAFEFAITGEIIVAVILLIIAVLVVAVLRALFILLPVIIVTAVVWFLTRNLTWAAIAFLAIAVECH